jgi:hypothetical protein
LVALIPVTQPAEELELADLMPAQRKSSVFFLFLMFASYEVPGKGTQTRNREGCIADEFRDSGAFNYSFLI